jgi:sporulation protein YlmC with PRC-barrel domain
MEIPLHAQVECTDGVCGSSAFVLINPVIEQVTDVVVKKAAFPHTEYIVPVDLVAETIAGTIQLRCSRADFEKMAPFVKTRFVEEKIPDYAGNRSYGIGTSYYWPYVSPDLTVYGAVEVEQIPAGEMSVCRGTRVEATDGFVGHVDEFVVNGENGRITHLVMREGHLWGKKDVIIPISAIQHTNDDTVFLNLDKHQIESLPNFPVHRHWA